MKLILENIESDIVDDFSGINELVSISSGDLYIDGKPFGYYCAMWLSEKREPLNMLVTAISNNTSSKYEPVLTIGIKCNVGSINNIKATDPSSLPWGKEDDGVIFKCYIKPEEYLSYNLAQQTFNVVPEIIQKDSNLWHYVCGKIV